MLSCDQAKRRGLCRRTAEEDIVLTANIQAVAQTPATQAPVTGAYPQLSSEELLDAILTSISADKAEEIVTIDLRGKTAIAYYMVIATCRSTRQVSAISEKLMDSLKQDHGRLSKVEGKDVGDWVLVDTGDIIVHIFRPEVRDFYQLEKMWVPTTEPARQ